MIRKMSEFCIRGLGIPLAISVGTVSNPVASDNILVTLGENIHNKGLHQASALNY